MPMECTEAARGEIAMRTLVVLLCLFAFSSTAIAENCRALPKGPERRACKMRNPAFAAKLQRCKELANERGFFKGGNDVGSHAITKRDFVRACMQGKQR